MRLLNAILLFAVSTLVNAAAPHVDAGSVTPLVSGRYVFEFGGSNARGDSKKLMNLLQDKFSDFDLSMPKLFDHSLMKGVTVQIDKSHKGVSTMSTDKDDIYNDIFKAVAESGLVTRVYPVRAVKPPKVSPLAAGEGIDISKLLPHAQTQVDLVHSKLKNTGAGISIGVLDSGVDYMHPALGGGFGEGYKVRYGRDLVGDDYNFETGAQPVPDDDPMDSCAPETGASGHGTHVSGIIAGKSENFTGVAPDATLGMWRVFGCTGSAGDDVIADAMLDAYDSGVDIISMSLGDTGGWSESPLSVIAQRITEQGVPVIIAAGNEGASGAFTVGSPSVGIGAFSVASLDNANNLLRTFSLEGSDDAYDYSESSPSAGEIPNGPIVAGDSNVGSGADGCTASNIPDDVNGKLALLQRGTCTFDEKANNAAAKGAVGVVIFNAAGQDAFNPSTPTAKIPVVGIAHEVGQTILTAIKAGDAELVFEREPSVRPISTGNTVSSFSSVGASYNIDFKPNIAGPGGNIYSALPRQLGTWGMMSGTSMATPYVSGSVALYLKSLKNGSKPKPKFILEHFQNYAFKAAHVNGKDDVESPFRQGAGLVQVLDTIQQTVHVSPGGISFNDTANLVKSHKLTITNNGDSIVSYEISNNVSVSIVPYDFSVSEYPSEPQSFGTDAAKLRISKKTVKISPGKSATITVSVIPPSTNPKDHIMYGGFIKFKSLQKQKDLTVPYIGIVGNQVELPIYGGGTPFVTNTTTPPFSAIYNTGDTYVYDRSNNGAPPTFILSLAHPTRQILAPLYNAFGMKIGYAFTDLTLLPRFTQGQFASLQWDGTYTPSFFDVPLPITLKALKGKYTIDLQALKWLGNPKNKKDWEIYKSCTIQIK
ncbi:peptidase S8/S53 domain-containing protein [Fennellomyces sp. T-0311]|nr:peptidase S8/S53 domain-containing protein [Fennellomyces sp. T-0311]